MNRGSPKKAILACLLGGIFCWTAIPLIAAWHIRFFKNKDRVFLKPVAVQQLLVRSDGYGKGHFGASRNGGRKHEGLDLLAAEGTAVIAAKSGRVFRAGYEKGYGLFVEILHPEHFTTRYAHLSVLHVHKGEWVSRGHVLGLSGRSGNAKNRSIKPHLHFEIRRNRVPLNPRPLLHE